MTRRLSSIIQTLVELEEWVECIPISPSAIPDVQSHPVQYQMHKNLGQFTAESTPTKVTCTASTQAREPPGSTFAQESDDGDACFVKYVLSGRRRARPGAKDVV